MTRPRAVHVLGVALLAAVLLASGCGRKKTDKPNMPFACETTQCVCTEADRFVWQAGKEVPVEWRLTGDAYCPEGYVLRLAGS